MARYQYSSGNNLVWITGLTMVGVTLFESSEKFKPGTKTGTGSQSYLGSIASSSGGTAKQLLAIGLLVIVMSFVMDQAPEFGKPFAILVLIAFLTLKTPVIKNYFNSTQGTTK